MFPNQPQDPDVSLAFSLLSAWSVADAELRTQIEALIAAYAARKPEFVQTLQRVTKVSEQLEAVLGAAHARPPQPKNIESLLLQYMTRKEDGAASA